MILNDLEPQKLGALVIFLRFSITAHTSWVTSMMRWTKKLVNFGPLTKSY